MLHSNSHKISNKTEFLNETYYAETDFNCKFIFKLCLVFKIY